jgi:hypothetical protein
MQFCQSSGLIGSDLKQRLDTLGLSESIHETHLVGSITVLDDSVSSNNDRVNVFMLEQGSNHGITWT